MQASGWGRLLAGVGVAVAAAAAMAQASRDLATRPPSPYDRDALQPTPIVLYGLFNAGLVKPDDPLFVGGGHSGVGQSERSRLGFRATEILGRGLQAHLQLEQSLRLDEGSLLQGRSFGARASVGMSDRELGRLDAGRMEQAASMLATRADPWGGGGAVGPGARLYAPGGYSDIRSSGMLAYNSPTDLPVRVALQVARPGPGSGDPRGHGGSVAWDRLPWLAGVAWQHHNNGERHVPLVLGVDDGTHHVTAAWTEGRSRRAEGADPVRYRNLFIGATLRGMAKGDPERHEWRAGLDLHRVQGDADGRLGSDDKLGLGWRYRFSRHTWTNLGAAWINPRHGPGRWGVEATLSYSFERDLRVPQNRP